MILGVLGGALPMLSRANDYYLTDNAGRKIDVHDTLPKGSPLPVSLAWMTYSGELSKCSANLSIKIPADECVGFDDEVRARSSMAQVWSTRSLMRDVSDDYLDGLGKIQAAGFIREYVWIHHRKDYWKMPANLRLDTYKTWEAGALPGFVPATYRTISVEANQK